TVCIALKIIAPSESHQDLTPSNCLMKKSLTVDNAWLIASFITLNCSFIESIAPVIIPIWSSVSPNDSSMLIPPASSPLNIAKIASKAVTTLSLNSITDSQAPTNLSFNPSIKFLNVSDLLYAMTKPAPSAAIAAMVKVIGLVSAPNNGANHLSSPPALVMEAINGANAPTTPETNVIILPTTINTGPAATTKPANTPITFCVVPLSSLHQLITLFTVSITRPKPLPIFSPISVAHSCAASDFSNSMNSPMESLECSNTPPKRFSPSMPIHALVFATIPCQESA